MTRDLPSGAVTFLFSDIEGSTRLLAELGPDNYSDLLSEHRRIVRDAIGRHGGVEFATQGDSFCVAFTDPSAAVGAASEIHEGLTGGLTRVRIGVHTGTPAIVDGDYVGADLHLAARISSAGHGGQTLLSAATRHLLAGEFKDLGEHRLKDFDKPLHLYQDGVRPFPPLRTVSNTNLPRPVSSFVGRERELTDLLEVFSGGARLVTLTGPGGTGKTRLAIETAAELQGETPDGVFWVDLAHLRDPSLVTETIAQTIGADGPLAETIGERRMLLVVDNLEQVVDAAGDLAALLATCPHLRLLVTSRERLRVNGEADFPVPPLADADAVELFCARARLDPDDTIRRLCHHLDNLPLAVELAAARTNALSPAQISQRLSQRLDLLRGGRDTDPRQQTLRATIAWSHDLLADDERQLFARLAVFRGGCSLDDAEEVCGADLETIASLVDKSLLRRVDDRYTMLETIREYAGEQLERSDNADEIRDRHADHYLALAEEAEPHLRGNPKPWLDRLETEHENLRAALDHFGATGRTQRSLQLAGALWKFWYQRGWYAEARWRLESALEVDPDPTSVRGRALLGASAIAGEFGDAPEALARAEEAERVYTHLGDPAGRAHARYLLAGAYTGVGDFSGARDLFEESVDAFRGLGDDHYVLLSLHGLAWTHEQLGDVALYRAMRVEYLELARAAGNQRHIASGVRTMGRWAAEEGLFAEALDLLREAYAIHREIGEVHEIMIDLCQIALATSHAGRMDTAVRVLAAAEGLRSEYGVPYEVWVMADNEATMRAARGVLSEEDIAAAWSQGLALRPDEAVELSK